MKTTLAIALAIALATGRPFLGVFKVLNPVRVLVCSGESGLAAIKETASRIAYAQGDSLRGLRNLIWSSDLPRFDNPVHLQAFRDVIEQGEIGVVILDPMYFCLPGADAGNLMVVGALLRGVSQICEETKTTLIVVHHVRKSLENPHDPPELSDVSWSGTSEWARQWILLSRRRRYEPGTGQHDLWMSVGGSAGHNGLWALDIFEGVGTERSWDVSLSNPDDARNASTNAREEAKTTRKAEQLERDKRAILDAVLKLPDHRGTLSEIRTRTGRNGQAFSVALADLVNDRHLVACQIPKPNGRQYEGFRLSDEQE